MQINHRPGPAKPYFWKGLSTRAKYGMSMVRAHARRVFPLSAHPTSAMPSTQLLRPRNPLLRLPRPEDGIQVKPTVISIIDHSLCSL